MTESTQDRSGRTIVWFALAAGLCLALTGCTDVEDDIWWDAHAELGSEEAVGRLEIVDSIPRPVDFRRLSQATYIDSQTIALVDVSDCHVWIWSRKAGLRELNKSCGEGPNELVRPVTVTSSSGILRVVDGGTNSIVSYGADLAEISRVSLPAGIAGEYVYSADDWIDDSITMSVLTIAGGSIPADQPKSSLAVVLSLTTLEYRRVPAKLPAIARKMPRPSGSFSISCASARKELVLLANPWSFEVQILRNGEGSEVRYLGWRLESDLPHILPGPVFNPSSAVVASGMSCGGTSYFLSQVHSEAPERRNARMSIRREMRSYDGEVEYRAIGNPSDARSLWLPVAAFGDEFLVSSTDEALAGYIVRAARQ